MDHRTKLDKAAVKNEGSKKTGRYGRSCEMSNTKYRKLVSKVGILNYDFGGRAGLAVVRPRRD